MAKQVFYAEYIGSFLPGKPWEGSVQSTHSKAVNLLHPSELLISIVNNIDNMTDYGLVVKDFDSLLSCVSNDSKFVWEGERILFSDIIVELSGASLWTGSFFNKITDLSIDIEPIKKAFTIYATEEGLSPVITEMKGNMYSNAAAKIIKKAVETANVSDDLLIELSSLVGMGIGFTPSGDDFLAGVMLYEFMSESILINREEIRAKLSGTTEGGKTLLILALGNSFPYYLKQFADSIFTGKLSSNDIVQSVVMHGSTSGSDALTGFIWASEKNEKSGLIKLT